MDKINIKVKDYKIELGINQVKFIVGSNHSLFHQMIQCFKKNFNKIENSEYAVEEKIQHTLLVNDSVLSYKTNQLHVIDPYFEWDKDIKLGTKSLTLKYMEAMLEKVEFNELSITINALINDLSEELSQSIEEDLDKKLWLKILELNQKNLLKNIELKFLEDDLVQNQYDLTYEEICIQQIKMINKITENNKMVNNWVILVVPVMNETIYRSINQDLMNLKYIIRSERIELAIPNSQLYWIGKHKTFDLANEVEIYNEFILDYPSHIEMEEAKIVLNKFLNNTDEDIYKKIHKLM